MTKTKIIIRIESSPDTRVWYHEYIGQSWLVTEDTLDPTLWRTRTPTGTINFIPKTHATLVGEILEPEDKSLDIGDCL